jgi:hypothetical protein
MRDTQQKGSDLCLNGKALKNKKEIMPLAVLNLFSNFKSNILTTLELWA